MAMRHDPDCGIEVDENGCTDTSLHAKSLQRALDLEVPKTLTPYEWEQWYAEHGIPQSHKRDEPIPRRNWWRLWAR